MQISYVSSNIQIYHFNLPMSSEWANIFDDYLHKPIIKETIKNPRKITSFNKKVVLTKSNQNDPENDLLKKVKIQDKINLPPSELINSSKIVQNQQNVLKSNSTLENKEIEENGEDDQNLKRSSDLKEENQKDIFERIRKKIKTNEPQEKIEKSKKRKAPTKRPKQQLKLPEVLKKQMVDKQVSTADLQQLETSQKEECEEHLEQKNYVCIDCSKVICSECILSGTHKNHQARLIKRLMKELESKVKAIRDKYPNKVKKGIKLKAQNHNVLTVQQESQFEQIKKGLKEDLDREKNLEKFRIHEEIEELKILLMQKQTYIYQYLEEKNRKRINKLLQVVKDYKANRQERQNETFGGIKKWKDNDVQIKKIEKILKSKKKEHEAFVQIFVNGTLTVAEILYNIGMIENKSEFEREGSRANINQSFKMIDSGLYQDLTISRFTTEVKRSVTDCLFRGFKEKKEDEK